MNLCQSFSVPGFFCFVLLFDFGVSFAKEDSPCPTLNQYIEVCAAQSALFDSEFDKEAWRYEKLLQLKKDGYASWQEVQRQKFNVDSISLKKEYFQEYAEFLQAVSRKIESDSNAASYAENGARTVRVFLPGSNRMIGWIQGAELGSYSVEMQIERADKYLAEAKHDLEKSRKQMQISGSDDSFRAKSELNLNIASQRVNLQKQTKKYLQTLVRQGESLDVDSRWRRTVSPEDDVELKSLVVSLASMEANFDGNLKPLQRLLRRERNRLKVMKRLAKQGKVDSGEINRLVEHVAELQAAVQTIENDIEVLELASKSLNVEVNEDSHQDKTANQEYLAVNQWPAEVVADFDSVQYLIEQRRNFYQEQARLAIATA